MNNRLTQLRRTLSFKSQKAFGEAINVPWRTIQVYEQGVSYMPSSFFLKLRENFNVSVDWLLTGQGEMFFEKNPVKITFENSDLIFQNLTQDEIKDALITTYVKKVIYPIFRDITAEQTFWEKVFEEQKDRISTVFYLLRSLKNIDKKDITPSNSKEILKRTIQEFALTFNEKREFMFVGKESLFDTVQKIDDLGCYIILTNSQKIAEVLSVFLNSTHLNNLDEQG